MVRTLFLLVFLNTLVTWGQTPTSPATSRTTLKSYFETDDVPTESQFYKLIDAYYHLGEDNLKDTIIKYSGSAFDTVTIDSGGKIFGVPGSSFDWVNYEPAAYYTFDTDLSDETPNGYDLTGTYSGTTGKNNSGSTGGSLYTNYDDFINQSDFTYAFWSKGHSNGAYVFSYFDGGTGGFTGILINSNGDLLHQDFNAQAYVSTIPVGEWTHIAVAIQLPSTLKIYVNGELELNAIPDSYSAPGELEISPGTAVGYALDEVAIFNSYLDESLVDILAMGSYYPDPTVPTNPDKIGVDVTLDVYGLQIQGQSLSEADNYWTRDGDTTFIKWDNPSSQGEKLFMGDYGGLYSSTGDLSEAGIIITPPNQGYDNGIIIHGGTETDGPGDVGIEAATRAGSAGRGGRIHLGTNNGVTSGSVTISTSDVSDFQNTGDITLSTGHAGDFGTPGNIILSPGIANTSERGEVQIPAGNLSVVDDISADRFYMGGTNHYISNQTQSNSMDFYANNTNVMNVRTDAVLIRNVDLQILNQKLDLYNTEILNSGGDVKVEDKFIVTGTNATVLNGAVNYYSGSLTDGAPTDAELDGILGTRVAGWAGNVKDTDGTGLMYYIMSDGTDWFYLISTKAL